jgi:hypothetical protein
VLRSDPVLPWIHVIDPSALEIAAAHATISTLSSNVKRQPE